MTSAIDGIVSYHQQMSKNEKNLRSLCIAMQWPAEIHGLSSSSKEGKEEEDVNVA